MNARRQFFPLLAIAVIAGALSGCGGGANTIAGAGATFPQPVYDQWAADLKDIKGVTVNYNPVGSGGGIAQFTAGIIDFGASDTAMDDEEFAEAAKRGTPLHIPSVFGSVTIVYRLPGVKDGLRLDGDTVAAIFLGQIKNWSDPAIARTNPGVKLPNLRITVVHRSDESGTTKLFTTYLADYSPEWEQKIGIDKSVKWPTGTGAAKNAGVAGAVKQTDGTIGYLELAYAIQNRFQTAALRNASGNYVSPTMRSAAAAGDSADVPSDLRFNSINSKNPAAYPISSATFLLVYRDMCKAGVKPAAAANTKLFFEFGLGPGQQIARKIGFAPLPESIRKRAQAKLKTLQCNGEPLK